jgi:hypothetical protein
MAWTATREATIGGDLDTWGAYEQAHNRLALGINTMHVYLKNVASVWVPYLTVGKLGVDDGSQRWVVVNDAEVDLRDWDYPAVQSCWVAVEVEVVSGAPVLTVDVHVAGGASGPLVLPPVFLAAYDGAKGGYYMSATKWCVALLWLDASGEVGNIINPVASSAEWVLYYPEWDIVTGATTITLTLPQASTVKKGDVVRVRLNEASGAGRVSLEPDAADTMATRNGTALTAFNLLYLADWVELVSDGVSVWRVRDFNEISAWQSTTTTWSAATTAPGKGTIVTDVIKYQRRGNLLFCDGKYMHSAAGSAGSGLYRLTPPGSLSLDTSEIVGYGETTSYKIRGIAMIHGNVNEIAKYDMEAYVRVTTDGYVVFCPFADDYTSATWTHASPVNFGSALLRVDFKFDIPVDEFVQYL